MMRPLRTQASRRALQSCCCSSRPVLSRHATQFLPAQSRSFHPPEYSPADQKDFNRKVRELVKSSPVPENARIAIVGAGLTGLTTAYYLAQDLPPGCKIVIYDGQNRVGVGFDQRRTRWMSGAPSPRFCLSEVPGPSPR
uniref:FAD dependent oxidoreductase domain-containing protein n=1 Tax=Bionectria ochroleuca TaxID=29856 RepID=A0A8H7TQZ6_BIOOC